MVAGRIGPKAETVVVLGSNNDAFHPCRLGHCSPLVAVECGGVEDILRFGALAPFEA